MSLAFFSLLIYISLKVIGDPKIYFLFLRLFNICEYTLLALFLGNIFNSKLFRKIAFFSVIPFCVFAVVDYAISDKSQFNNHSNIVSSLLLIVLIVYFFYEKMNTVVLYPLYQTITFWICVGLFLYFAGSFFFFLFIKTGGDHEFVMLMSSIYSFVTIIKDLLLGFALFASENSDDKGEALHIPIDLDLDGLSLTNPKNL